MKSPFLILSLAIAGILAQPGVGLCACSNEEIGEEIDITLAQGNYTNYSALPVVKVGAADLATRRTIRARLAGMPELPTESKRRIENYLYGMQYQRTEGQSWPANGAEMRSQMPGLFYSSDSSSTVWFNRNVGNPQPLAMKITQFYGERGWTPECNERFTNTLINERMPVLDTSQSYALENHVPFSDPKGFRELFLDSPKYPVRFYHYEVMALVRAGYHRVVIELPGTDGSTPRRTVWWIPPN